MRMRRLPKTMAGRKEERGYSVKDLLCSLCEAVVGQEEKSAEEIWRSNPLRLPSHLYSRVFKNSDSVKKHLFKTCYDLLLLRRNEWYGRWSSPLTPECRCLAYGYHLQQAGQQRKANRLLSLLDSLVESEYEYVDSVLTFLSILSAKQEVLQGYDADVQPTLSTNAYTYYSHSLFHETPGTSLHYKKDKFLSRPPGTGLMGFCSQNDLQDDLHPPSSSLFSGLTHTTTPTVNTVLHIPLLTNEQPDLLDRYLKNYSAIKIVSKQQPFKDQDIQNDSLIELIDRVDSIGNAPPTSWEGLLEDVSKPYLSESGPKGFTYSARQYVTLLEEMSGLKKSPPPLTKRSLKNVTTNMATLKSCEDKEAHLNSIQFHDEVTQSFYNGVRCMMHTCRVQLDQLLSMEGCTDLSIQFNGNQIMHLIQYVDHLLHQCDRFTMGLTVLNNLFDLCTGSEGLPPYQLILGLFRHSIRPYLSILELWVYLGQYLRYSHSLGIMADQTALDRRDHLYWARGFSLPPDRVPVCLVKHTKDILNVGRSLNLLNLISPKHHLCNSAYQTPQLIFSQTLRELHDTQEAHNGYQYLMESLGQCLVEQRNAERQEKEMIEMEPVLRARRAAQKFMDDIKQKELDDELAVMEKKQSLMVEQREELELARARHLEEAAQEKERDRILVNRLSERDKGRLQKEAELKEKARSELVEYYHKLTKEAELRTLRAQWRAKRFALARARLEYFEREQLIDEQELIIAGDSPQESYTGSQDIGSSSEIPPEEEILYISDIITNVDQEPFMLEASTPSDKTTPPTTPIDKDDSPSVQDGIALVHYPNTETPSSSTTNERDVPLVPKSHPSQSTIQELLHEDSGRVEHSSTRGKAPLSTVQDLLYPRVEVTQAKVSEGLVQQEDPLHTEEGLEQHDQEDDEPETEREPEEKEEEEFEGDPSPLQEYHQSEGSGAEEGSNHSVESSANKTFDTDEGSELFGDVQYPKALCYSRYHTDITELSLAPPFSHATVTTPPSSDPSLLLWSVESLIELCIVRPILLQSKLVNSALVDYFINELNIKGHFINLKQFLFLEDGEFTSVLTSLLFEKLIYGQSVHEMCSASFLRPVLMSALEGAHSSKLVPNLRLWANYRPKAVSITAIKALCFLKMEYTVEWPLNIVIHHDHLNSYNKVFHLMLEIKRCSWALKNVFLRFTKGHRGVSTIPSTDLRLIHAQRQELQHFVTVMEGYISNQIFHLTWKEFDIKLSTLTSLDELVEAHEQYLETVLFKCLLVKKTHGILTLIEECLACVIKFCNHFLLVDQFQSISLSGIHKKFREISSLLFKVVTKLVQRGYQPHLEELLLRMNFNKFYKH